MKISIIIATFNSEATLSRCLDSVINQSFKDFEILVKDGASNDSTINILDNFQGHFSYYVSSPDNGTYDAWNDCVYHAIGDWLLFLGSDDYFYNEDSLSKVLPYLDEANNNNYPLVHGKNFIIRNDVIVNEVGHLITDFSIKLRSEMIVRHPGCFHNREQMIGIGLYDSTFRIVGDYDLVYRLVAKHQNTIFYPFSIVCHVMGGLSTNPLRLQQVTDELFVMRKKNNIEPFLLRDKNYYKRKIISALIKVKCLWLVSMVFYIKSKIIRCKYY